MPDALCPAGAGPLKLHDELVLRVCRYPFGLSVFFAALAGALLTFIELSLFVCFERYVLLNSLELVIFCIIRSLCFLPFGEWVLDGFASARFSAYSVSL